MYHVHTWKNHTFKTSTIREHLPFLTQFHIPFFFPPISKIQFCHHTFIFPPIIIPARLQQKSSSLVACTRSSSHKGPIEVAAAVEDFMGMGVGAWSLEDAMNSGFAPVWGLHESIEELKHKLLRATLELESLRANAKEEMRKNEENISQLLQLLQVITQQRDEAREQLQLLLTNITQPKSPQARQARASSNITESDSLSGTPKNHSYGGSPAHSLFNVAASPELLSMKTQGQDHDQDMASAVMDDLATKPLPQKGKLLQAVLEAGPLLQTLLLAGPLPQWRNPPPLQQFQVPPVSINAHKTSSLSQKVTTSSNDLAHYSPNLLDSEKSISELHIHSPDLLKRTVNLTCMRSYDSMSLKRQKNQCTGGA